MSYIPPFTISAKITKQIGQISAYIERIDIAQLNSSPQLRKQNRIKTITGTLAIEGNTLNLDQVTAIIEGKRILGNQREIAEVVGAIKAYDALPGLQAFNEKELLLAHQMMMGDILRDAGRFRQSAVGVHKGGKVVHIAPPAGRVPQLINNLIQWCGSAEYHPLIISSVFHYEFEFIHPFIDGNGRIGRLWQTLILGQWNELFFSLPLESLVKDRQAEYYDALEQSDNQADSTQFIEFMLESIEMVLGQSLIRTDQVSDSVSDQVTRLLAIMDKNWLSREEMMRKLKLSHNPTFRKNYLNPALKQGLVVMRDPQSPRSPQQKYRKA